MTLADEDKRMYTDEVLQGLADRYRAKIVCPHGTGRTFSPQGPGEPQPDHGRFEFARIAGAWCGECGTFNAHSPKCSKKGTP